jgi:hypothetical protein
VISCGLASTVFVVGSEVFEVVFPGYRLITNLQSPPIVPSMHGRPLSTFPVRMGNELTKLCSPK